MTVPEVVLYSRVGCHLCDEAMHVLTEFGLEPKEVDIDGETVLFERFNEHVPVVFIDGRERFRGQVDRRLLRRLLAKYSRRLAR